VRAELHGKVSPQGSVPADRLEDTLTDAVFSAVRYLPHEVLGDVLDLVFGHRFSSAELTACRFLFWPRFPTGTEPDVVLEIGKTMIIIEAKYHSPFSSGQLEREWRDGWVVARARKLRGPWLFAVTTGANEPGELDACRSELAGELDEARISWLPWHRIGGVLADVRPTLSVHEQAVIDDVLELMERRGVRHMFDGFELRDYWIVTAAQRVAAESLYPQVANAVLELNQSVNEDGLRYANTSRNAIAHWQSLQLSSPDYWGKTYVLAPYWASSWGEPIVSNEVTAALFVIFNFWNPQVEVGFLLQPTTSDRERWVGKAGELAAALASLAPPWRVVSDPGGWTRTAEAHDPSELDEAFVASIVGKSGHLRFLRVIPIEDLQGVEQLRTGLLEAKALVDERPVIQELVATG
jgi:hypothetical protein